MAERRYRDFLRISLTAKSARVIQKFVVERTLEDHASKCVGRENCPHDNLPGSRAVDVGLKIGRKRSTLDLMCPYTFDDVEQQNAHVAMLKKLANRIKGIGEIQHAQVGEALLRIHDEIMAYADRNPMVVIAEAALPPSGSRARK
jgi:hypothetical protein